MADAASRKKIAVLGGGVGAMAAVYGLTSQPGWRDRFEITVYQMGWRLGGKGASGRNRTVANRIEEHGFHMWMGFYNNAFRIMQEAYAERRRVADAGCFQTWTDAFKPHSVFVFNETIDGESREWVVDYPTNNETPGTGSVFLEPWDYVRMMLEMLAEQLVGDGDGRWDDGPTDARAEGLLARLRHRLEQDVKEVTLASAIGLIEVARHLARAIVRDAGGPGHADHHLLRSVVRHLRRVVQHGLEQRLRHDDTARRLWLVMDLGCTFLIGILEDDVIGKGFDSIDDVEFRQWLQTHGASEAARESVLVEAMYTADFSYLQGDRSRPDMAAGVAVQCFLRLFLTYKGALAWKLQAGMGDVVFAPLYQVLKARGVRFEFFSKVTGLRYDARANAVSSIEMERQAVVLSEYDPLIRVQDLDCWPSTPKCELLAHGDELEAAIARGDVNFESHWSRPWRDATPHVLRKGADYDLVVLGISLGALGTLCREIVGAKPRWRDMVTRVQTVQTQSQQLWFEPDLAGLGWTKPSCCAEGYAAPMGQWLDSSQVIPRETWPAGTRVGSIIYFCDTLADPPEIPPPSDPAFPTQTLDAVKASTARWLDSQVGFWPDAVRRDDPHGLDWNLLVALGGLHGKAKLGAQYVRVNIDPSERFVLSATGTTAARLRVDESDVEGLYLTGDWIRNGFNVGCVESTVISGLQCSRAICGSPQEIIGEHFFAARP